MAEDELCVRVTFRVTGTIRNNIKNKFYTYSPVSKKKSKIQQLRNV